jgi:hypothetical protein
MALGAITPIADYVIGDRRVKSFSVVGPTTYTAGGEVLTPTQLGFVLGDSEFDVQVESSLAGVSGAYDYAAQKLKMFAGAAEATGNLSTSTFRVTATGKYSA